MSANVPSHAGGQAANASTPAADAAAAIGVSAAAASPTAFVWQARDDRAEGGDTRRLAHVVRHGLEAALPGSAALIGFASDAGVQRNGGRTGAADGPDAIRRALAPLPAHRVRELVDAGTVACAGDALEQAQQRLASAVQAALDRGLLPVALGGGHEVAWGSFQGLQQHLDAAGDHGAVLTVNLDAHFDLRGSRPGHSGSPFDQIAESTGAAAVRPWRYVCLGVSPLGNTPSLYARAARLGAWWVEDADLQERHLEAVLRQLEPWLDAAAHVHLSVDLDVLPQAVAPGVSAPAALGVPLSVIEALCRRVGETGKLRLLDVAELNPAFDRDQQTARAAARLVWRVLQQTAPAG